MDMMETIDEEDQAKATDAKRRSTHINDWEVGLQLGSIEEGLCDCEAAIVHFRKGVAELQKNMNMIARVKLDTVIVLLV